VNAVVAERVGVRRGGRPVVHDVDLIVGAGAWVALVGPNGAGKSSLLHAIAGLVPHTGSLRVHDLDPRRGRRRAVSRVIALVPQRPVIPEGVDVRSYVILGRNPHLGRFTSAGAEDRRIVEDALARLDLLDLAGRHATDLSGGELQRVVLARALAQQPRVLLLDEPTTALDLGHQQEVLDLVDALRVESGITVLCALHDLTLAAQYAHRLVLLDRGRVREDGSPRDVLDARLLSDVYRARVEVLGHPGGPVVLPVREASERDQ
jgi:iron complex transport system ATP-binding protein